MLELKLQYQLKRHSLILTLTIQSLKFTQYEGLRIGKTTVLNMIAGLRTPDKAYIKINDRLITDTEHKVNLKIQNRKIGYLFQDYQLFPNMTVYKNITFMSKPSVHIDDLMDRLNIHHLKEQYPSTLSRGESQRVALARTLSTKPDLIFIR